MLSKLASDILILHKVMIEVSSLCTTMFPIDKERYIEEETRQAIKAAGLASSEIWITSKREQDLNILKPMT